MSGTIEVISLLVPKNNANLPVVDVNDLKGGFIQLNTYSNLVSYTTNYTNRLKEGMLCFISDEKKFYQYLDNAWGIWDVTTAGNISGGSAMSLQTVSTIADLDNSELKIKGQVVYVDEINGLRFYSGTEWMSFSEVYIQDTEPSDTRALWIDTSEEDSNFNTSNTLVKSLLQTINLLAQRVLKLEALKYEICPGDFSHNMDGSLSNISTLEPDLTTETDDDITSELLYNTALDEADEPDYDELPNTYHITCKYGTYANMNKYKDDFVAGELLWCYDKKQLWIKDPNTYKLILVGTAGSGGTTIDTDDEDIMNGITQNGNYISSISFVDMTNTSKHYTFSVQDGELSLYDESLDTTTRSNTQTLLAEGSTYYKTPYLPTASSSASATNALLFINLVYSTGESDSSSYSLCNYEFIELANLTLEDISLNGLFLHYTERGLVGTDRLWITLPLKGKIKSGSTFLIRCAKCGQDKYAKIKVGKADMIWTKEQTLYPGALETDDYSVWNSDNTLKIAANCSLFLSGPLYSGSTTLSAQEVTTDTLTSSPLANATPWVNNSTGIGVCYGFIDLVGFGAYDSTSMPNISTACSALANNKLYVHYYDLDNVSQAYKSVVTTDWANNKTWSYINLDETNPLIDLNWYQPKNSTEGKTIFYNKHLLTDGAPNFITCTFGFNPHTTRCFTWVSKGYRNEYLRYRKQGETNWTTVESFKEGDGRSSDYNRDDAIYNRIRSFTTDGTYFTVHKLIIDLYAPFNNGKLTDGPTSTEVYEYQAGYDDYWTEIKTFTLRNRQTIISNGFNFVQVTDQQGFNHEEYITWKNSADYINANESDIDFSINTGDATQNGNRINEWVDYFDAGDSLFNHMEQQYTVGNNDLCPVVPYELGLGTDATKQNPINVQYFFTYEHPNVIPKSTGGVYVPSVYSFIYGNTYFLSMNSEITVEGDADVSLFSQQGASLYGTTIKEWCDNDLTYITDTLGITPDWKIAYCHENPFTLLIKDVIDSYVTASTKDGWDGTYSNRGTVTSHLNSVGGYWFSKFLEDNKFNLSICGHKHTFTTSYYMKDNTTNRMLPTIFLTGSITLSDDQAKTAVLSTDTSKWYVKYTMCQATGYKTISNKELPGNDIGWLESYYPCNSDKSNDNVKLQRYPHYIVWNIGKGTETETGTTTSRARIKGDVKKLWCNKYANVSSSSNKPYNFNTNVCDYTNMVAVNGNGVNGNALVIVEKGLFGS